MALRSDGPRLRRFRLGALAGLALLAPVGPRALAHDMHGMQMDDEPEGSRPVRSTREYAVPDVRLVRQDGKAVSLRQEMDDGRPVVLNFIYTTCTDICPLMSSVLEQFQRRLGAEAGKVHLMSISIDPEQDTPARLAEYARRFHAGPGWQHYTGTLDASIAAQRAFGVYLGTKSAHSVVTLVRAAPGKPWLRIDGIVKPDELVHDYRDLIAGG